MGLIRIDRKEFVLQFRTSRIFTIHPEAVQKRRTKHLTPTYRSYRRVTGLVDGPHLSLIDFD